MTNKSLIRKQKDRKTVKQIAPWTDEQQRAAAEEIDRQNAEKAAKAAAASGVPAPAPAPVAPEKPAPEPPRNAPSPKPKPAKVTGHPLDKDEDSPV